MTFHVYGSSSKYHARLLTLAGFVFLASSISAHAQISLSAIVDLAQRQSSAVRLAQADLDKANALYTESRDVYVPNLILGSSIGPPSIGFSFSQASVASATMQSLAFSYPQRKYTESARIGIEAATLNLKDAREQVALEASTAYLELDTLDQELAAGHQQSQFSERLVSIENDRSQAGVDPSSELLQARLTAAQLNLKLIHVDARVATLRAQLAALTGLAPASILTDHASIPQVPEVRAVAARTYALRAADAQARAKQLQANGDYLATRIRPLIGFGAQYNRDATSLNNYNTYFSTRRKFKADNFVAGFNINIPVFDLGRKAKARESAADALRATIESEQAQRQNDLQIATLNANLRELDAFAQVASLKQEIAADQLKTVQSQLELGNGAGVDPGAPPQLSPKAEQLAHIDERQKFVDSLDAQFDLTKTRLNLLRALGHMEDWINQLHPSQPAP